VAVLLRARREPDGAESIVFARSGLGLLVREENHGGTYQHRYDALGNLSESTYPDGRALETQYDVRQRLVSERRYQWDRADQIVRQMFTDGTPDAPEEKYRQSQWGYDAAGRMTQSLQPASGERFWWDAADNRTTSDLHPVWNNMLRRLDGVEREYDGFGRMTVRRDRHRSVTQRFSYDDEHRISGVQIEGDRDYARAAYRYDALGRRTEKAVWRHGAQAPERTAYAWSGMQMVGERSDRRPDAAVQYVYEENSYSPLARVDSTGDVAEIYWYHAELNGLPERMTDADGETVWRGAFTAWGRTLRESARGGWRGQQNLRFQGQYLDRETGLHYNTLRYYDAWGGCYTQVDPIGLAGGLNTYGYVVDPLVWVDPLGLCSLKLSRNMKKAGIERPANSAAHHIVGDTSKKALPARAILSKHGIDVDDAVNGVFLPNRNNMDDLTGILHNGKHPDKYFEAVNRRILLADEMGGRKEVINELNRIRETLSGASRNSSWYNIL